MKDKTFLALSALFFIVFIIGVSTVALNSSPFSNILKAKDVTPSPLKSFGVVFPQVAPAGVNSAKVKVSVYIRGVDGSILPNRNVKLQADMPEVVIEPSDTAVTNNIGQAEFMIKSNTAGTAKLLAKETGSNIEIVNIPTVEFTQ
jgi:hypothetical protein